MPCASFRFTAFVLGAALVASSAAAKTASPPAGPFTAGRSGALFQLPNHTLLRLAPGTRVRFEHTMWLKLGTAHQPATRTYPLKLLSGRVDATAPKLKLARTAVLVKARRGVNAVAMGGHSVIIEDARSVTTGAMNFKMLVALGNSWRPLPAGRARSFSSEDPSGNHWRTLLAPPSAQLAQPLTVALPHAPARSAATWTAVPQASRYKVTLLRIDGHAEKVKQSFVTPKTSAVLSGLTQGRYALRVASVDRYGLEGPSSAPARLNVIGAALPAGAYFDGHAVELAPGQKVHFNPVRGLRVSYGAATASEPAPADIGLTGGRRATLVRFRRAGSATQASVLLEPREWRADVTIGPKAAHWPTDRVVVRVRVFDKRGRPLPTWLKVIPKVFVQIDPVTVHWVKSGHTLTTVVPPPAKPGPWVVRVDVNDQFGQLLGRNFLEVAPYPRPAPHLARNTWSYPL